MIRLQKDASNSSAYAIDYINTEQVAPIANPDPAKYVTPAGFGQQDVQNALDRRAQDTTGKLVGVYLPAGQYQTTSKFQVSGKAVKVVGAGPWYTQFNSPSTQDNTDVGFSVQSTANGSSFSGFGFFGNYTSRIDGPGKVFDLTDVSGLTIDNVWIEHTGRARSGAPTSTGLTATNLRIRDTFADGINLTNGSQDNLVGNDEARSTGDDSFALFAAQDHNSSDLKNNTFQNLSALTPWRAAGIAVYGGYANTFQNLYVADTLTYAGITISSLNFGYPFEGFGASPQTVIQNVSLVRDGGHFWNGQVFPAIWVFSATQPFQGIRVNSVDITDPDLLRDHVPDRLRRRDRAQPGDRHDLHRRLHHRRPAERRHLQRQVRLRHLGQPVAGSRSGPGRRLGDLQEPHREQQLRQHPEHHLHLRHQRPVTPDGR